MIFSERFVFRPHQKKGKHWYDGTPCPTKEVYESIGEVGIKEIHRVMHEMLEVRKKMFGYGKPEYSGFTDREVLFDMETRTGIELLANAKEQTEGFGNDEFAYPELLEKEDAYIIGESHLYKKNLGKRAFQNKIELWLSGRGADSLTQKQDDAIQAVMWLKDHNFKVLMNAVNK